MRIVSALLVTVVLAGCGTSSRHGEGEPQRLVLGGQRAIVVRPSSPNGRVVLFMHGAGQAWDALLTAPERRALRDGLFRAGYSIAASEGHGNNWGSPAGVRDYRNLTLWLRERGYEVDVLAESMGGLAAFDLLGSERFGAVAALYPVCVPSTVPGAPPVPAARVGDVSGTRLLVLASSADTVVPKRLNADVCARAARRHGASVEEVTTTGDHGDPSNLDPDRLLRFYAAAARVRLSNTEG